MVKTNIFVDCHVFDGYLQGTTTYLKGIYKELLQQEDKHFFFASHNTEKLKSIFGVHSNVTYLEYQSSNKFYRLLVEIPRLIKIHKIEFAHFQYIVSPIKRCKYIVTIHDVLFLDFPEYFPILNRIKNHYLYKWSAKFSDIKLTVSEYSKNQISKHFNIQEVYITKNGVEGIFFEAYDKEKIKKEVLEKYKLANYLIYVSRWEPRKNHHLVLKSFVNLALYKDHQMVFIGETTFKNKEYDDYYSTLDDSIKNKITNLNKIDFEAMLLLLRGAKVAVYPSIAEGFGIPPLESLAAKIPTVCSNATAMQEFSFLKEYSFNPKDPSDFEQKLIKSFTITQEESDAIQQKVKQTYNWTNAADVLNKAIAQHK